MTAPQLLSELQKRGIKLNARGNKLQYDAPKGELAPKDIEAIRLNKAALLSLLEGSDHEAYSDCGDFDPQHWDDLPEPVDCLKCGSFNSWWDLLGDRHCMTCDPPLKAIRLLKVTERIRRQRGLPSPAGVKEHLAELSAAVNSTTERLSGH